MRKPQCLRTAGGGRRKPRSVRGLFRAHLVRKPQTFQSRGEKGPLYRPEDYVVPGKPPQSIQCSVVLGGSERAKSGDGTSEVRSAVRAKRRSKKDAFGRSLGSCFHVRVRSYISHEA